MLYRLSIECFPRVCGAWVKEAGHRAIALQRLF